MIILLLSLAAYLIGSISFAVIVSRAMGLPDPRSYGSQNPGATNVLRSGKIAAAALTLIGDGAKGWLAVLVAARFCAADACEATMAAAGVAVVLGHLYPVFFRFEGGKGVSTALGVLIGLNLYLAAGTAVTWLIIAFFFRISSLAALVSALFAAFFTLTLYNAAHPYFIGVSIIAALVFWRHRANIHNLVTGSEGRIGGNTGR